MTQDIKQTIFSTWTLDIDFPTTVEIANQLESTFSQEQAEAIAEYVFQPLKELIKNHIIGTLK